MLSFTLSFRSMKSPGLVHICTAEYTDRVSVRERCVLGLQKVRGHLNRWSVGVDPPQIHVPPFLYKLLGILISLFALAYLLQMMLFGIDKHTRGYRCTLTGVALQALPSDRCKLGGDHAWTQS